MLSDNSMHPFIPQNTHSFYHQTKYFPLNIIYIGSIIYLCLSNSRVSKVITAVENKGYIRRNINKNDKRQMCFSLTPGGKEKIQQMMNAELCFDGLFEKLKTCMEKG